MLHLEKCSLQRVQHIKFSFGKSVQLCQFTLNDPEGQYPIANEIKNVDILLHSLDSH